MRAGFPFAIAKMVPRGMTRRFSPPRTDAIGHALAYVDFEDERGRRAAAKLLTCDEARRIAGNIAKLPKLVGGKA